MSLFMLSGPVAGLCFSFMGTSTQVTAYSREGEPLSAALQLQTSWTDRAEYLVH